MLNFLRKLRRNDVNSKYLKYAIGEIVLVVIGILIALSINNWNEARKASILELKLLKEVEVSMQNDSTLIWVAIRRMRYQAAIASQLRDHLTNKKPYRDSLDEDFAEVSFLFNSKFNYSAFESLSQAGLNLIQNDSLRLQIPNYYKDLRTIEDVGKEFDLPLHFRKEIYPKYFESFSWGTDGAHPIDYEQLRTSYDFLVALDYVRNDGRFYLGGYRNLLRTNQKLLAMIRTEIEQRE